MISYIYASYLISSPSIREALVRRYQQLRSPHLMNIHFDCSTTAVQLVAYHIYEQYWSTLVVWLCWRSFENGGSKF